jgi:hypothetical protein
MERDPLFIEQQAEWAPESVWVFWRRTNPLSFARNQTMTSQMSSPQPIQYTNYVITVPYVII